MRQWIYYAKITTWVAGKGCVRQSADFLAFIWLLKTKAPQPNLFNKIQQRFSYHKIRDFPLRWWWWSWWWWWRPFNCKCSGKLEARPQAKHNESLHVRHVLNADYSKSDFLLRNPSSCLGKFPKNLATVTPRRVFRRLCSPWSILRFFCVSSGCLQVWCFQFSLFDVQRITKERTGMKKAEGKTGNQKCTYGYERLERCVRFEARYWITPWEVMTHCVGRIPLFDYLPAKSLFGAPSPLALELRPVTFEKKDYFENA